MSYLFFQAGVFNQNIGSWDVRRVTNMYGMFYEAHAFKQNVSSWDVSNVTSCSIFSPQWSQSNRPSFSKCNPDYNF